MGPDIMAFSAILQPGQQWPFDTVHKGTPDADREPLMAGTSDLALEIWAQARDRLSGDQDREKMRAYVLGHLCHIAGDVISHPFINDIEWHDGTETREKLEHADGEGSHDAMTAQRVFMRDGTRGGEAWGKWWPELDGVPPAFFQAYEQALENIYKARSQRPRGLGEFERKLAELDPPGLDVSFVEDGYRFYRNAIIDIGYGFGFVKWLGMLAPLFLPAMAIPFLIYKLPRGSQLFIHPDNPADEDSDRKWFEVLSLPLYAGAIDALFYGIFVACLTTKGVKKRSIAGIVISGLVSLATIGYAVEVHERGMSKETRWPLLFVIPLVIAVTFLIIGSADAASDKGRRSAVSFIHALPFVQLFVFLFALVFFFQLGQFEMRRDDPMTWILLIFWTLVCGILWVVASFKVRDAKIPEHPDTFAAQKRHAVRLFDDASHYRDRNPPAGRQDRFFPSGRRPIMRLWWTGTGTMAVRSDRYGLVFKLESGGTTSEQELPAPIAPMRPAEYLGFLAENVQDRDGSTGKLQGSMTFPDDEDDYELPPGATFAAHGDTEKTQAKRREESAKFKELGRNADSDFVLYHAPKPMRAIRFVPSGPMDNPFDLGEGDLVSREAENGYLYPHDQLAGRSSETVMSYAADVAAFLCLGGASHMDRNARSPRQPGDPASPDDAIEPVYQVFRNWSLDRRRVNEWKMLVAGGALSEKPNGPATYDAAMLHGSFGPSDPAAWRHQMNDTTAAGSEAAALEGEEIMRKEGWVQLLRKWLELERQPDQDLIDPNARLFPDWPTNQQLSRGLAYLLDLPEPA
jgi:hypothetical protein